MKGGNEFESCFGMELIELITNVCDDGGEGGNKKEEVINKCQFLAW